MEAFSQFIDKKTTRELSSNVNIGSRGWAQYYSDHEARFIRITDLTRDSIDLKNDNIQYVLLPEHEKRKYNRLESNDMLVSITADLESISLIPEDIPEAYINQHIAMIRFLNPNQGKFMTNYLRSEYGQ